jgi:hypothetical protein
MRRRRPAATSPFVSVYAAIDSARLDEVAGNVLFPAAISVEVGAA